jgi:hypothetical protein
MGAKKIAEIDCLYVTIINWFTPSLRTFLRSRFTIANAKLTATMTTTGFHSLEQFILTRCITNSFLDFLVLGNTMNL